MAVQKIVYPYITTNPEILNGVPIIEGTRIPVRALAGYYRMGMSVAEIVMSLPYLTMAQAHAALAYYFDHQGEVDKDIERSNDIAYWKAFVASHSKVAKLDENQTSSG